MATISTSPSSTCFIGSSSSLLPVASKAHDLNQRGLWVLNRSHRHRSSSAGVQSSRNHSFRPKATALRSSVEEAALARGVPASVPVRVAHELLQAGHRYLDVRTPEEFSAGHASGAINIPYMYRVGSGMTKNVSFVKEVSARFTKDDEIIVGCQSGKRSMLAAKDLLAAGFYGIVDIAGGYGAWTQSGLPTD
ncbi:thiosulfate sulfurtransferase 16, chloroplastic [Punica granatum]|uniref:Rhodanese domain-containing protein n=2 Tax=Punica granatum TaxID=22663 RepID=A0A218W6J0_PUNGR|nr:thiosulfate sulfurtransferase 16, chloroplastic [Punica granatum]OWM68256.1 hypothetical protein CDL15_Pgr004738 [Punica granatum]PKI74443.1 hypothetical protein CRG98_005207 [Punica granatum]